MSSFNKHYYFYHVVPNEKVPNKDRPLKLIILKGNSSQKPRRNFMMFLSFTIGNWDISLMDPI